MTAKEQERKALEQIKKIIAGLGENSYVGTAFKGCVEDAETNIEWDAAFSLKDSFNTVQRKLEETQEEVKRLSREAEEATEDAKAWREKYTAVVERRNEYHDESIKNWNLFREQEDKVAELELEIIKLKARLFDLIDKQ